MRHILPATVLLLPVAVLPAWGQGLASPGVQSVPVPMQDSGTAAAPVPSPAPASSPARPAPTLTPELARDALTFLGRAQLTGAEAPRFMSVAEALRAIAAQPAPPSR